MRRPIPGYEGFYEIDDKGNVYSMERLVNSRYGLTRKKKETMLRPSANPEGYLRVSLGKNGADKIRGHGVHRLVMLAFRPIDGSADLEVNHKDGNKANNNVNNLEWCTSSENHLHAFRELGRVSPWAGRFGADHPTSIAVIGVDRISGAVIERFEAMEAAYSVGYNARHISECVSGKRKTHGGLVWQREDT